MYEELIRSCRACATGYVGNCDSCMFSGEDCYKQLHKASADAIEELDMKLLGANAAIAGMQREIERMVIDSADSKLQWIPVTERLPKADEHDSRGFAVPYLVLNGWMRVTARRTEDHWVLFGEGKVLEYVTHWMRLPDPPKEDIYEPVNNQEERRSGYCGTSTSE